jgi:glycosyltransferase involved in cell wall biosynthesis
MIGGEPSLRVKGTQVSESGMKICLISNLFEPYQLGGTEFYVRTLVKALKLRGHEVFVISTRPAQGSFCTSTKEVVDEVPVYRFYPWNVYWGYRAQNKPLFLKAIWHSIDLWNPQVYLSVKRILAREQPEVIHINNVGGLSNSIFCKINYARVVYFLHDYISLCPKSILLKSNADLCNKPRLLCRIYQGIKRVNLRNKVDVFVSPSSFLLKMHQRYNSVNSVETAVVPYGIEISPEELERLWSLKQDRTANGQINALYLGRVDALKGLLVLSQAFKLANREDLRLHIAGVGDCLPQLQREFEGNERVVFHGYVDGREKEELFLHSDVCILPSIWYDNNPLVILEAYKYGLPVIGSKIGGIPEMIQEKKTGFLFEPGDQEALASVLRSVSREQLHTMSRSCHEAARNYSMDNHLDRLMAVYKRR